ncbi:MAG: beta-galactosidase [Chloroflexota bacterium]|nr:beta-galactosidase [Chloroflexota bacterium]
MHYGVDYYPEHWPEERWPEDARLMTEAGFNIVRLGEFAWSLLEPQEGTFVFDWLDRAIDILAEQDIQVILGTPTAAPPPWLTTRYPEVLPVGPEEERIGPGGRRHYCPSSPVYRRLSRRITQEMAVHYAQAPTVIGWQIDNELSLSNPGRCYCPACQRAFQDWLRERYGSLEALNEAWGTVFWSQVYTNWPQIPTPLPAGADHNPGLLLDYYRFQSDAYMSYAQEQLDILREVCPDHFVTHNVALPLMDVINNFNLASKLDFLAQDTYPGFWQILSHTEFGEAFGGRPITPEMVAMVCAWGYDAIRGNKQGEPFWVMEQQAGPAGQRIFSPAPRPNQLRLWAYQALARGARAITHFRWRTCTFGAEEYWHGVLDHDGVPRRRYEELKTTAGEMNALGDDLAMTPIQADVALLFSYDSAWALAIQPCHPRLSYAFQNIGYYTPFYYANIPVDIVAPDADLSGYKMVLAPALHVVTPDVADRLSNFVREGGTLVVGFRSGVKDKYNRVVTNPLPGLLAELLGMEVTEYDALYDQPQAVRFLMPELEDVKADCELWADVLQPTTAEVLARYTMDYYAGRPAITLNCWGQGQAIYMGTGLSEEGLGRMLLALAGQRGVTPLLGAPEGVEVARRGTADTEWWFVLNHTSGQRSVDLPGAFVDALSGRAVGASIQLDGYDVRVLRPAQ